MAYGESRHVTLKGQGRDPDMFGAQYLENGRRYRLAYNGAPMGNGIIMANRMMTFSMTSRDPTACAWPLAAWRRLTLPYERCSSLIFCFVEFRMLELNK